MWQPTTDFLCGLANALLWLAVDDRDQKNTTVMAMTVLGVVLLSAFGLFAMHTLFQSWRRSMERDKKDQPGKDLDLWAEAGRRAQPDADGDTPAMDPPSEGQANAGLSDGTSEENTEAGDEGWGLADRSGWPERPLPGHGQAFADEARDDPVVEEHAERPPSFDAGHGFDDGYNDDEGPDTGEAWKDGTEYEGSPEPFWENETHPDAWMQSADDWVDGLFEDDNGGAEGAAGQAPDAMRRLEDGNGGIDPDRLWQALARAYPGQTTAQRLQAGFDALGQTPFEALPADAGIGDDAGEGGAGNQAGGEQQGDGRQGDGPEGDGVRPS